MPDPTYATTRTAEGQRPPQAQNHVAGVVAATLASAGVRAAIGLDDPQPLFASLRDSPLQTVLVHDERSGAFMADGYARATGRPALSAPSPGPVRRTSRRACSRRCGRRHPRWRSSASPRPDVPASAASRACRTKPSSGSSARG